MKHVKAFIKWSTGLQYTYKIEYPTWPRINSFAAHLDTIHHIEYYKFTNEKNKVLLEKERLK